jgi:hypothetical protein
VSERGSGPRPAARTSRVCLKRADMAARRLFSAATTAVAWALAWRPSAEFFATSACSAATRLRCRGGREWRAAPRRGPPRTHSLGKVVDVLLDHIRQLLDLHGVLAVLHHCAPPA